MFQATRRMTYNHRMLAAGDRFDVTDPLHGRLLVAHGKAVETIEPVLDDVKSLRAEYRRRFGKRPRITWGVTALRARLAAG